MIHRLCTHSPFFWSLIGLSAAASVASDVNNMDRGEVDGMAYLKGAVGELWCLCLVCVCVGGAAEVCLSNGEWEGRSLVGDGSGCGCADVLRGEGRG